MFKTSRSDNSGMIKFPKQTKRETPEAIKPEEEFEKFAIAYTSNLPGDQSQWFGHEIAVLKNEVKRGERTPGEAERVLLKYTKMVD